MDAGVGHYVLHVCEDSCVFPHDLTLQLHSLLSDHWQEADRTSWVAPGLRVVHGHGGGLTTMGAGGAAGRVVEDDSPRSHSLRRRLGLSFPPLIICLVVRLAFQDLYCKYMPRTAMPAIAYNRRLEPEVAPVSAERLNRP